MAEPPATRGRRGTATVTLPVHGMDCAECVATVRASVRAVPGVVAAEVLLGAEKAVVTYEPARAGVGDLRRAIRDAGYRSPEEPRAVDDGRARSVTRTVLTLLAVVLAVVLVAAVVGEGLGAFRAVTERVPWWVGAALVVALGWPVFRTVARNALRGRIVSHTLMSLGAAAALAIGQWPTAVLVVVFMRVGDYAERATAGRARSALRELATLAPRTARLEVDGEAVEVPVERVRPGDTVVVRPGEIVPVDGDVIDGHATVSQAAVTGEAMPVEAGPGTRVFASTVAELGSLRIRATHVGEDATIGRVIRLVEQAESNRGATERVADRFAAWYLPLVAALALATYLVRGDALAAVAVTVVACSCAFALATPVAMLASIGAAAQRGLLIKGGRVLEALARADVLLLDKTGTVTLGTPEITDVLALAAGEDGEDAGEDVGKDDDKDDVLAWAAAAERDSEHPLAAAVRRAAAERGLLPRAPEAFVPLPGIGVRARVDGREVEVGSRRMLGGEAPPTAAAALEAAGKSLLYVRVDGRLVGVLAAADTLRHDVAEALAALRPYALRHVELLTGDHEASARATAERLGIAYRAELLPDDKIEAVRALQARGHTVVMIGDGVNDAPALAQADVGIAMGAAGTDVAQEAAHVALMGDDWRALPELFAIARRTLGVVRLNIGFTAAYNLVGLSLAALGYLPPVFAAALQSLPDLGIMGNSARLLRPPPRAGA